MIEPGPRSASGFRRLGERVVHEGHAIRVVVGEFETPDGETVTRDLVRHPGAVSVVPVDGDEVVLVRQYRPAVEDDVLEIPAGKRDVPGEPPEVTAIRELEEEVGFTTDSVVPLARFFNSVGFSDEYSHVFLATDLRPVALDRQGPEEQHMTLHRRPLAEAVEMCLDGWITDAKSVAGILAAARRLGV